MAKRTRKPAKAKETIPGLAGVIGMDIPEVPEALAPPGMSNKVPPRIKDGSGNPDHWRYRQALISNFDLLIMTGDVVAPKGWDIKKSSDMLASESRFYGIDPKHLADVRSEGEKHIDATVDQAINLDRMLEWADDTLRALETGYDYCDTLGAEVFESRLAARAAQIGVPPPDDPLGKLRSILHRVRTLRERARNPVPKTSAIDGDRNIPSHPYRDYILESTHLARYMLYVGRSTISGKRGGDAVLRLGRHHIEMIVDTWEAEKRAAFIPETRSKPSRIEVDRKKYPYEGVLEVAPPGHGKTTIVTYWCMKRISLTPDEQGTWLHDKEDQAWANVEMVKHAFKRDSEYGRRNLSLFPHLRLAEKGNTTGKLTLYLDRPVKAPTLVGKSVWSSDLGTDNSFQVIDDVVPQKDIHEHSRRERRVDMIATTWASRLREQGFRFIVGTMWHHEDVLAKMLKAAQRNSNPIWLRSRVQKCERRVNHGGGERFIPLWEEMYPSRKLASIYHQMENKLLWYANYEGNPNPHETRIIKKLRLYDPTLDEHAAFLSDASAAGHISLDPAWTNREHSDKAGMIIGVLSKVRGVVKTNGGEVAATESQIRLTHAHTDKVDASAFQEMMENLILRADGDGVVVDEVHIETNSAGAPIAVNIENAFQEHGVRVNKSFSVKSKEIRLLQVMGMLNDSPPHRRACFLFPGKARRDDDGELVLDDDGAAVIEEDPEWKWLYRQVLDFKALGDREKDTVDAITLLCNGLSGDVESGRGVITRAVRARVVHHESEFQRRVRVELSRMHKSEQPKDWEMSFIQDNWR